MKRLTDTSNLFCKPLSASGSDQSTEIGFWLSVKIPQEADKPGKPTGIRESSQLQGDSSYDFWGRTSSGTVFNWPHILDE